MLLAIERRHDEQCDVSDFPAAGGGVGDKESKNQTVGFIMSSESGRIWSHLCMYCLSPPVQEDFDQFDTTVVFASGALER